MPFLFCLWLGYGWRGFSLSLWCYKTKVLFQDCKSSDSFDMDIQAWIPKSSQRILWKSEYGVHLNFKCICAILKNSGKNRKSTEMKKIGGQIYSWPCIPMDSTSTDSTTHGLEIFKIFKKNVQKSKHSFCHFIWGTRFYYNTAFNGTWASLDFGSGAKSQQIPSAYCIITGTEIALIQTDRHRIGLYTVCVIQVLYCLFIKIYMFT